MIGNMIVNCALCNKPITGKFLVTVLDKAWHSECVRCFECGASLTDKCFSRDDKIYCKTDFYRRYGTKCNGCGQGIVPSDLVRKAKGFVFHLKCFTCNVCQKELDTGEQLYVFGDNKFICRADYESNNNQLFKTETESYMMDDEETIMMDTMDNTSSEFCSLTSPSSNEPSMLHNPNTPLTPSTPKTPTPILSNSLPAPGTTDLDKVIVKEEDDNSDDELKHSDDLDDKDGDDDKGGNKRRGPRTTIKAKQLEVLKNAFNKTPKPTRHIREQLTKETGLPMRVVQVWFQNKRSKERRMKQLSQMGMRPHMFGNPRKLRDLPLGMEDHYGFFPPYNGFPGQGFPYFGQQPHMPYPQMAPGMEQPLPPGGPMGPNTDFMPNMGMMPGDNFSPHSAHPPPPMNTPPDESSLQGNPLFSDRQQGSEILAW